MTDRNTSLIITGAAGFIGRNIARHFSSKGWSVIGVDSISPENAPTSDLAQYHSIEIPDSEFTDIIKSYAPVHCVHCAGRASVSLSVSHPESDYFSSPVLTFEVLNALRHGAPECKFAFLSSAAVYGNPVSLPVAEPHSLNPISPYGFHKLQCEILCREFAAVYKMSTVSLRIFSAYGPGLRRQVIWDIFQKLLSKNRVVLQGTGNESRDFIHVRDIARAVETVFNTAPMEGEAYNLASGREITIRELAELIQTTLNHTQPLEFDGHVPPGTPLNWKADIQKISQIGFKPAIALEEGIAELRPWIQSELG